MPGLRAKIVSDSASLAPRISRWVSVAVWLAVTKATLSGFLVLIGGWGWFWFWGICWCGSGPIATSTGATITSLGLIVMLIRVEPWGRCSLAWRDSPQPARGASAPTRPAGAAAL